MGQRFGDSKGGPDVKRTIERTLSEAKSLLKEAQSNPDIVFHKDTTTQKDYTRAAFHNAVVKYRNCQEEGSQELREVIKKMAEVIESRVYSQAYRKQADSKMAMAQLVYHYDWEAVKVIENREGKKNPLGDKARDKAVEGLDG